MNRKGLMCAAVFAAIAAQGGDEVTRERFPDADSVVVNEIERVDYAPDGTSETWEETWTKILTEKGRREESTTTLDYSKRYGQGEIVSVSVLGTNGIERTVDVSKTTKESTDNSSMAANIYDPLDRKIVCRIPGLKIGETVHVKTHRKVTNPRTVNKWSDLSVMEWTSPILKSTYEVKAPAALPIRRKVIRHSLGNIVERTRKLEDGSTLYTFVATNSPQVFPEPDMPPLYTQVQNIRLSTAKDWPEISRWYADLCEPHLMKTNAAMVRKVQELGPDIRKLFKFVSQEVRYMGLTMEDTSPGYSPHDVDITFDNRYGVCRDKAALLVAMLRLAGFRAFPVLIHVGAKLDPEVPQPFFNHAIVAVEQTAGKRDYLLMDPTNENTKDLFPSYLCNNSYLVARADGEELKISAVVPPEKNALDVKSSGTLSKDGSLFLSNELSFGGINDTVYRGMLVKARPQDRIKFFERWVKRLSPGAELVSCEIEPKDLRDTEKPLRIRLASKMPEMLLKGKTQDELSVPFVTRGFGLVNYLLSGNTALEKRKYPLVLDSTAAVHEEVTIDVSAAVGAALVLPNDKVGEDAGYRYARSFALKNGVLSARRDLSVGAVEFSPDAYLRLREDIKRVEAAERKRPVFVRDNLSEARVRIRNHVTETTIFSDTSWVTTNTIVKEVLTYEGKRKSAELRLGYNPSWETVELLSAVVSNRDGQVHRVTAREKNVMDCSWAASAPRYPAGKLLVVNLPSVEIGSVISYQTVTTVTNAPAPFYDMYSFDTDEPVDHRRVRVNDWVRDERNLKMIPNEPGQPYSVLWRDVVIVSKCAFHPIDFCVDELDPACLGLGALPEDDLEKIRVIRKWMDQRVKVVGPGLYALPLSAQLTDPATVVAERYATRLDYVRTLVALLRGAGLKADVVLGANNANDPQVIRHCDMYDKPDVRTFASALCRVKLTTGGFFGLFGDEKTYFIGTENEYTPLGATSFLNSDYFDPETGTFGLVTIPEANLKNFDAASTRINVRENGAVDMTIEALKEGPGVGSFRKRYEEMLPEDRSRHYQAILGEIAQAASATSELVTDTKSYPAKRTFSCYVPDYATVGKQTITLQLPALDCPLPNFTGSVRETPFAIQATDHEEETYTVVFPEGYTEIEHLPEGFVFANPSKPDEIWLQAEVSRAVTNNVLTVTVSRKTPARPYSYFPAKMVELIRDWRRMGTSRANRTIVVRERK